MRSNQQHTVNLSHLPGVSRVQTRAALVGSRSAAIAALSTFQAATAAGDRGAINIWKDDSGNYTGEFQVMMATKAKVVTRSKTSLGTWLKEYWPKMQR